MATKAESGPNQAPPQGNGGTATAAGAAGTSAPESVSEGDLLEALAPAVEGKPSVEPAQIAEAEGVAAEAVTATWGRTRP